MNYGRRQARSEGFPAMKTIQPPGIRSKKQLRNQEPGARRKRKKKLRTRTRRKKTRVTVTQGSTTTTTHHRRLCIDWSPGLPPRNRFPVLNGKPSGTNPGLGVASGNGPGGDR